MFSKVSRAKDKYDEVELPRTPKSHKFDVETFTKAVCSAVRRWRGDTWPASKPISNDQVANQNRKATKELKEGILKTRRMKQIFWYHKEDEGIPEQMCTPAVLLLLDLPDTALPQTVITQRVARKAQQEQQAAKSKASGVEVEPVSVGDASASQQDMVEVSEKQAREMGKYKGVVRWEYYVSGVMYCVEPQPEWQPQVTGPQETYNLVQRDPRVGKHWKYVKAHQVQKLLRFLEWVEEQQEHNHTALPEDLKICIPPEMQDTIKAEVLIPVQHGDGPVRLETSCSKCLQDHSQFEYLPTQGNVVRCIACHGQATAKELRSGAKVGWYINGAHASCQDMQAHVKMEPHAYRQAVHSGALSEVEADRFTKWKMKAALYLAQTRQSANNYRPHCLHTLQCASELSGRQEKELLGEKQHNVQLAGVTPHSCLVMQAVMARLEQEKTGRLIREADMVGLTVDEMHRKGIKWHPDGILATVVDDDGVVHTRIVGLEAVQHSDEEEFLKWQQLQEGEDAAMAGEESESEGEGNVAGGRSSASQRKPKKPFGAQATMARILRAMSMYHDSDEDTLATMEKVVNLAVDGCPAMQGKHKGLASLVCLFAQECVTVLDDFHGVETGWRGARKKGEVVPLFLGDVNYIGWMYRRDKKFLTELEEIGCHRSISAVGGTRQIEPTLTTLDQIADAYGAIHEICVRRMQRLEEQVAAEEKRAQSRKEKAARASVGDQAPLSQENLPTVPRKGQKRTVEAQPQPDKKARSNEEQATTSAAPAELPDEEPPEYTTRVRKIAFFKRVTSKGFCVLLHGLIDVLNTLLPLTKECQTTNGPTDVRRARGVTKDNLDGLLRGDTLTAVQSDPLSTHKVLKAFLSKVHKEGEDIQYQTDIVAKDSGGGRRQVMATLSNAVPFSTGFLALREVVNAVTEFVQEGVEQPRVVRAVEALGVALWADDDERLAEAVDACETIANSYHRLHLMYVRPDFQALAKLVRERRSEVEGQLSTPKLDTSEVSKTFWQEVCGARGVFADIVGRRPLLRVLAKVCLTVTTASSPIERFFSTVKLNCNDGNRWHPVPLLRQLRLQLETPNHLEADVTQAVRLYKSVRSKVTMRRYWRKEGAGRKGGRKRIRTYDKEVVTDPQELVTILEEEVGEDVDE